MPKPPAKIPFTPEAYQELEQELQRLQTERVAVLGRLQEAREMGDLSENGAYKYAKLELGTIGRRLRELRHLLSIGAPTLVANQSATIGFGSTVTIKNPARELTFLLVSQYESNPAEQKLSTTSPIGAAVLGKKVGDHITVETPNGPADYQITHVL